MRVLLLIVFLLAAAGCRHRESVIARFWQSDPNPSREPRTFPERDDPLLRVARTVDPQSPIGVCFSGGAIRSACATLGQLRALRETGLLDQTGYVSCVSGGAWSAVPFIFYNGGDDETFLGASRAPEELQRADFEHIEPGSLAEALSETEMPRWLYLFFRLLFSFVNLRDNEWFGKLLEQRLLTPFCLNGRYRYVTQHEASLREILRRNPQLDRGDFVWPNPQRPFLIVVGAIRRYDPWPWFWLSTSYKRLPLEMTPLYVGLPHLSRDVGVSERSVGGAYVEPLAYGAQEVRKLSGELIEATLRSDRLRVESQRFNLIDMISISGSAPSEYGLFAHVAFPNLASWSADNPPAQRVHSYVHADGGLCENLAIMPLLARRVPYIIAFVNAETRGVPTYVRELFGRRTTELGGWHARAVFPPEKLLDLEVALSRCEQGGLPFHLDTYLVHGPAAGDSEDMFNLHLRPGERYEVKVAWFFLESTAWSRRLQPELAEWMARAGDFANFPRYKTFLNRSLYVLDPTPRQVNALAELTGWLVRQCEGEIRDYFNLPALQPATTSAAAGGDP